MAEGALFSVASKILSTIASPAFEKAYERAQLIQGAKEELRHFKVTIETVQAVLLDAEKKQAFGVKDWVKRVKDVLYDAEDLFDEIATADLCKKQMKGNKLCKKVQLFFSKLNPLMSSYFIATRVKTMRKSLLQISEDMSQFQFVTSLNEEPIFDGGRRVEAGSFVDSTEVIGRDDEKKAVIEFLVNESNEEQGISLIAIVGIGGMGKTTLAQLVYNDEGVKNFFKEKWWASISDTVDDKEVIGKIFQSMTGNDYHNVQMAQLQYGIRQSVNKSGKFLLVVDDVWDEDHARWRNRLSLLRSGGLASKIIVTTRSQSVARAMDVSQIHQLEGLTEDKSWELFESLAFSAAEQKEEPIWASLGREILKKCSNVPLAIKSVASLLFTKSTLDEWRLLKEDEISKIEVSDNPVISALRLSYDHLPSHLKQCFAYCSLFPKDYLIGKTQLIYLWIAQGYVKSNNEKQSVEEAGHAYFMELLRRSFLQESRIIYPYPFDVIFVHYKMHDIVHDLAQAVAGDEIINMSIHSNQFCYGVRHLSFADVGKIPWKIPAQWRSGSRLRSLLFITRGLGLSPLYFDQELTKFQFLRALDLRGVAMEEVPSSIGELKHLRYLDLSLNNQLKHLPKSITKLVNLLSLDISGCGKFEDWPDDFRKLINLRNLNSHMCRRLQKMPAGLVELTSLRCLPVFRVGIANCSGGKNSDLGALSRLMLKGSLFIDFANVRSCWVGDECRGVEECWELPVTVEVLKIQSYPGRRIPSWGGDGSSFTPNIVELHLRCCRRVKHLPPLRCLPYLKELTLEHITGLEYVEEDGDEEQKEGSEAAAATTSSSASLFFPCLKGLALSYLKDLKGFSRKSMEGLDSFPLLLDLHIEGCPGLRSMPLCPRISTLELVATKEELIPQVLSGCSLSLERLTIRRNYELKSLSFEALTTLRCLEITSCPCLENVKLAPMHLSVLEELMINDCSELDLWDDEKRGVDWDSLPNLRRLELQEIQGLVTLSAEALTSLRHLYIKGCRKLSNVKLAPPNLNLLEELMIDECKELELWDSEKRGVDWDSLPNLHLLTVVSMPETERLPDCLHRRQALGQVNIVEHH